MRCPRCNRNPCICRFCGICNDYLSLKTDDVYCSWCADELQVTQDGKRRIITATAYLPIDLPFAEQIKATARMQAAVSDIAAVYQVNKETT